MKETFSFGKPKVESIKNILETLKAHSQEEKKGWVNT